MYTLNNDRPATDETAPTDTATTIDDGAGGHMHMVTDHRVVFDEGIGIDDAVGTDMRTRVDDGTMANGGTRTYGSANSQISRR